MNLVLYGLLVLLHLKLLHALELLHLLLVGHLLLRKIFTMGSCPPESVLSLLDPSKQLAILSMVFKTEPLSQFDEFLLLVDELDLEDLDLLVTTGVLAGVVLTIGRVLVGGAIGAGRTAGLGRTGERTQVSSLMMSLSLWVKERVLAP